MTSKALERMRLPRRFWKVSFRRITDGDHKSAIENYAKRIVAALKEGYGMVLWGSNGVGKTAAAAACLIQARRYGATGLFITANEYVAAVEEREQFDDAHSVEQRCKMVDLLVIDDLGKESSKAFVEKDYIEGLIEDLVRHRSANMRSTIITMNLSPEKMQERYGRSFARVMQESNPSVKMVGPSQREMGKEELVRFFNG